MKDELQTNDAKHADGRSELSAKLELALKLIKDSLPPYDRSTNFIEFHITFGNGIALRDANGTMIAGGYGGVAAKIVNMGSNA